MKNKPLAFQIWVVIACSTISIFLLVCLFLPPLANKYLSNQIYKSIENEQLLAQRRSGDGLSEQTTPEEKDQELQDKRAVRTFLLLDNGQPLVSVKNIPEKLLELSLQQAASQSKPTSRYSVNIANERVYYIIRKVSLRNRQVFQVSYMWDTYYRDFIRNLVRQLVRLMAIMVLLSLFPAIWLARYVSGPLVRLESFVKNITDRKWKESLNLNRKDEIGRLAYSIEVMRDRLNHQDDYQQTMLQHISHELKTPVMVIRSYISSIQDGIYPKGDLEGSLQVIGKESDRLEQKIRSLLYLTKLDYLAAEQQNRLPLQLDNLAEAVIDRLRWRRPELEFSIQLIPAVIMGDPEQWTVAMENLLDNQIRHARSRVGIRLEPWSGEGELSGYRLVYGNDGPPLAKEAAEQLFQTFRKGPGGQFGLGLAIVRRVAGLHQAKVTAANTSEGVEFRIEIPSGVH